MRRAAAGLLQAGLKVSIRRISTAADAVARDDMYVCEDEGSILASAIINYQQVDVYVDGDFDI